MPANLRAHVWAAGIFFAAALVLWFVIVNPRVILWFGALGVSVVIYRVLSRAVRAGESAP